MLWKGFASKVPSLLDQSITISSADVQRHRERSSFRKIAKLLIRSKNQTLVERNNFGKISEFSAMSEYICTNRFIRLTF